MEDGPEGHGWALVAEWSVAVIWRTKRAREEWVEVAHLIKLFRLGLDPEDRDGEGGDEDVPLWPPAGVPDPLVLDDAVWLDPATTTRSAE